VPSLGQIRTAETLGVGFIVAPARRLVGLGDRHLAIDQSLHQGLDVRAFPFNTQPLRPLHEELAHHESGGSLVPCLVERTGRMILGFAGDLALLNRQTVDADLHQTAPRPRLRLRRTIW
jgi:hypothetical protein